MDDDSKWESKAWNEITDTLMAHCWQNKKGSIFLTCHCHKIYRVEAVGWSLFNYDLNFNFGEYVKLGAISWKFDLKKPFLI